MTLKLSAHEPLKGLNPELSCQGLLGRELSVLDICRLLHFLSEFVLQLFV